MCTLLHCVNTQNSFSEVSTQEVDDAIYFIGGLDDISFGDSNVNATGDIDKLFQNYKEMHKFFLTLWMVNRIMVELLRMMRLLSHKSDGAKFFVGDLKDISTSLPEASASGPVTLKSASLSPDRMRSPAKESDSTPGRIGATTGTGSPSRSPQTAKGIPPKTLIEKKKCSTISVEPSNICVSNKISICLVIFKATF